MVVTDWRSRVDDSYVVGDVVGTGVYGIVSTAKGRHCGRDLVLKVVERKAKGSDQEALLHGHLDHPHIVRVYETFVERSRLCIVMEHCAGGELFDALQEIPFLKDEDARNVFGQVMGAVHYLHCHYFAHRDLKLENFLLSKKGVPVWENTVKLIDFGMVTRFRPGDRSMRTMCGSPGYTAPEVLEGLYDEKCDIFSCGVILFSLFCGRLPFRDNEQACQRPLTFHPEEEASICSDGRWLLEAACRKDPNERLSSQEVMDSPWLGRTNWRRSTSSMSSGSLLSSTAIKAGMSGFKELTDLQKLCFHRVAYNSDDREVVAIRDAFLRIDADGDGRLTHDEFRAADTEGLLAHLDIPHTGHVVYTEFLAAMLHKREQLCEKACRAAFQSLDADGNGSICAKDLAGVHPMLLGGKNSERMIEEVTGCPKGTLSFTDFVAMLAPGDTPESRTKGPTGHEAAA